MSSADLKSAGNAAFAAGNYTEAESLYSQAIDLAPENHVR
jgi:tetratricopeptide (TPR) repeat protein